MFNSMSYLIKNNPSKLFTDCHNFHSLALYIKIFKLFFFVYFMACNHSTAYVNVHKLQTTNKINQVWKTVFLTKK